MTTHNSSITPSDSPLNSNTLTLDVDIQRACNTANLPTDSDISLWVKSVLCLTGKKDTQTLLDDAELTVRTVALNESQTLNRDYRGKDKPTNVLSFPSDIPADVPIPLLGDLIICSDVVAQEARDQNKTLQAHWAHMVIHGCLHLLGFDHIDDDEADEMEALEINLLNTLGFSHPYTDNT